MAEAAAPEEAPKKSRMPLLLGVVLALAGGGGGFYAVNAGLLPLGAAPGREEAHADDHADHAGAGSEPGAIPGAGDFAFVELPPVVISLGPAAKGSHLRFLATLEVPAGRAEQVAALTPRVIDAMNGYLRALTPADIEAQDALVMIRAQLTRRVQLVLGRDNLRDLLVLEFVLN